MPDVPDDIPLRTTRLRDLPPELAPAAIEYGLWNRPDRPKVVGIIGWVSAAVGYLAFVFKASQLPSHFMDMTWLNPDFKPPPYSREQFAGIVFLLIAEMLLGLACIAGALGTLKMREWGRRLLISYALAALVLSVLKAIFQFHYFDFMVQYQLSSTTQPIDRRQFENAQFFNLIVATAMMPVWPLLVLGILTRRHVKQAFARAGGTPLADDATGFRSNGTARR